MTEPIEIYDNIADEYDERYLNADALAENEFIRLLATSMVQGGRVLDVGAGTGLALDLGVVPAGSYVGLDPSKGMLDRLVEKHREVPDEALHPMTFEEFIEERRAPEDLGLVISLFGSPSYIRPEYIHRMFSLAPRVISMHYIPGYWPEYESKPPTMDMSLNAALRTCRALGGSVTRINNFIVTVVG